jgi:penicillin-binding protein 1C
MKPRAKHLVHLTLKWLKRSAIAGSICALIISIAFTICWRVFPLQTNKLDDWPASPRVTDRHGQTMLQLVSSDDQWRVPVTINEISPWLKKATIAVEDQRFHHHHGVDLIAIARAAKQNLTHGRVISGASTLSMQVCRMANPKSRTLASKVVEAFRALQLEQRYTKEQILNLYLNIAPYGGNVRGVETASQVYFNKHARHLSLPEAALLAGLPQSPERFRPDRFPDAASKRRAHVLARMVDLKMISQVQADDASSTPIDIAPLRPQRLASTPHAKHAQHAAWLAMRQQHENVNSNHITTRANTSSSTLQTNSSNTIRTTINLHDQQSTFTLAQNHMQHLPAESNVAVVVIDIPTGEIRTMIGSANTNHPVHGQVNGAIAKRSPGSALKPFVFAAAFESKRLNEESMLYDGPIERAGWSPKNFDGTFAGRVTVTHALQKSLNVPAIVTAEAIGVQRCAGLMSAAGIGLPDNATARGGLAIVTGAIETNLLSLTNAYATLGRGGAFKPASLLPNRTTQPRRVMSPDTCSMLDDILSSWSRRPKGMEQLLLEDLPWFMWKTGTSAGRRDAWAVGHNGKIAIGVWVGRFEGSGDFQYVGSAAAEPLLAQLFALPRWRTNAPPRKRATWIVTNPLPKPIEEQPTLRITSPRTGSKLIAIQGQAIVYLKANQQKDVQWFLNDTLLDMKALPRLAMLPGTHTIRCVKADGQIATSRIEVR